MLMKITDEELYYIIYSNLGILSMVDISKNYGVSLKKVTVISRTIFSSDELLTAGYKVKNKKNSIKNSIPDKFNHRNNTAFFCKGCGDLVYSNRGLKSGFCSRSCVMGSRQDSIETRLKKSESAKLRVKNYSPSFKHYYKNSIYRSNVEYTFANKLDSIGVSYEYEPKTHVGNTYLYPDFYLSFSSTYIELGMSSQYYGKHEKIQKYTGKRCIGIDNKLVMSNYLIHYLKLNGLISFLDSNPYKLIGFN
jgi:hypothetical protein